MNIAIDINEFNKTNIYFGDKTKNTIIKDSDFYNLHYSTNIVNLNNLILHFKLYDIDTELYFNKYKCIFNTELNKHILNSIINIEKDILSCFKTNKVAVYKLKEQLERNNLKIINNGSIPEKIKEMNIAIKVSGLWENENNYGIIYKFYSLYQ